MTSRPFARSLAVIGASLVWVAVAVTWLTIDTRTPSATAPFYIAIAALLTAPLVFAAHRLGRADDATGLVVAALTSAGLLVAAVVTVTHISIANKGYTFYLILGLFIPPLVRLTVVLVPLLLVLGLQLLNAIQTWRAIHRPTVRFGADGALAIAIVIGSVAALRSRTLTTPSVRPYSTTTVQHELLHVYVCLWQRPGFPAKLDSACLSPAAAPGSAAYGSGYTLDYHPRPGGFVLVTSDAGHRPAESFWLDESGALRRSSGAPVTSSSPIWNADGCQLIANLARQLDEFRSKHPSIGYPDRLTPMPWPPDTTDDGVFRTTLFGHRDTVTVRSGGATEIRTWNGRRVVYQATSGQYTVSVTATDSLRGANDSSLISDARLDLLRSYLRDPGGAIHVTGALRAATSSDPATTLSECGAISPADARSGATGR